MSWIFRRKQKKQINSAEESVKSASISREQDRATVNDSATMRAQKQDEKLVEKNIWPALEKNKKKILDDSVVEKSRGIQQIAQLPETHEKSQEKLAGVAYEAWREALQQKIATDVIIKAKTKYLGQIDVTHAHPTGVAQFYARMETRLSSLIREPKTLARAKAQLAQLRELTREISEEHGYAPVSLAAGRITWTQLPQFETQEIPQWNDETYDATGELRLDFSQMQEYFKGNENKVSQNIVASTEKTADLENSPIRVATEKTVPALFCGVRVEFLPDGDAKLRLSMQVTINPEIITALRLGGIEPERIAKLREMMQSSASIEQHLTALAAVARAYLPGFKMEEQNIIGCFNAPSEVLLADLEAMSPYIHQSGIVAALAGDKKMQKIASTPIPPGMKEDRLPEAERGVGDLDPAELSIVEAVASGRSLVIDAPAGSRRAETLASIMADAAASGKSLIFVPSRGSAGSALKKELENLGLSELVLDFSEIDRVAQRIRTGLRLKKPAVDFEATLSRRAELIKVREELSTFIDDLHQINSDWEMSIYDLLKKLAQLTAEENSPRTRVRFNADALSAVKNAGKEEVLKILHRAAELGILDYEATNSAWSKSRITSQEDGVKAIQRATQLNETILPDVRAQVARSAGETGLHQAQTPAQWFEQIAMFEGISQSLDYFLPKIFESSVRHLVAVTATKEWRAQHGATLRYAEKRMFRRELADLLRPGAVPADIHSELLKVEERRETWRRYTKDAGWPILPSGMAQIKANRELLERQLSALMEEAGIAEYQELDFADITKIVASLVADSAEMELLPERNEILAKLKYLGIESFVEYLRTRNVSAQQIDAEFELAFTSSIFEQLLRKSKLLAALGPRDLTKLLEDFRKLDLAHINSLAAPVQLAAINNMRSYARAHRDETIKLDQLLAKYDLGVLRDVIATYPRLVQLARPIWIVPATIAVSYIPQMRWVDLVICDTTERTELAATIPTLLRGKQLVIVGDSRRDAVVYGDIDPIDDISSDEQNADSSDVTTQNETHQEMLERLSKARAFAYFAKIFPVLELPTLRAEHDEISARALLAHGYQEVYEPIPACTKKNFGHLIVVDGRGVPSAISDGAIEAPAAEVEAVVDVILNYALDRNPDSLAVITISPLHARQIRKGLQDAKVSSVILERFMTQNEAEPFTVIDISQAYGLRRDHVIISPGFGKTVHGRVLHSFGQLQEPQGFLDLIDSLEVARKSLTVVSSLGVGDIDVARVTTPGPKLLAQIISEAGNTTKSVAEYMADTADPLLADLGKRLSDAGLVVGYEYGFADTRKIPMVVGMPGAKNQWELAVLIDNEEYVAERSLRRRDRFLPEMVNGRGWMVYQTFSTSLFIDPAGQAAEIIELINSLHLTEGAKPIMPPILDGDNWVEEPLSGISNTRSSSDSENSVAKKRIPRERISRPNFVPGLQLSAYTDDQLDEVLAWIASDNIFRDENELTEELRAELGILRQGAQIDAVLRNVVRRSGLAK